MCRNAIAVSPSCGALMQWLLWYGALALDAASSSQSREHTGATLCETTSLETFTVCTISQLALSGCSAQGPRKPIASVSSPTQHWSVPAPRISKPRECTDHWSKTVRMAGPFRALALQLPCLLALAPLAASQIELSVNKTQFCDAQGLRASVRPFPSSSGSRAFAGRHSQRCGCP